MVLSIECTCIEALLLALSIIVDFHMVIRGILFVTVDTSLVTANWVGDYRSAQETMLVTPNERFE